MDDDVIKSVSGLGYRRSGSGPVVVLLHGIPGSAASWSSTVSQLPETLDVIVLDLLGFGASTRPRTLEGLHATSQASALAQLLDELDISSATIVGHDFGGPVALALHRLRPDLFEAVGLLATNAFTDTPIPFPLSLVNVPFIGGVAARTLFSSPSLRMMLRQGVGKGTKPPESGTHLGDRAQQQAIATIFAGSLTRLDELYSPLEEQLSRLELPVFVGWGDIDPFFDVAQGERTAQAAGAELRLYAGAGHFLPHERPAEVAADIAALVETATRS
jgi:pimeloyl-ACP methyl ester carboxylesterase